MARPASTLDAFSTGARMIEGAHLAEGFEEDDGDGVREVERSDRAKRGDAKRLVGVLSEEVGVEARALFAEEEGVAGAEVGVEVAPLGDGAEEAEASSGIFVAKMGEIEVLMEVDEVPVVNAGAPDAVLVDAEAEAPDEVEAALGGRGEARDVPGVLGDLGIHEDDVKRALERGSPEAGSVVLGHAPLFRPEGAFSTRICGSAGTASRLAAPFAGRSHENF